MAGEFESRPAGLLTLPLYLTIFGNETPDGPLFCAGRLPFDPLELSLLFCDEESVILMSKRESATREELAQGNKLEFYVIYFLRDKKSFRKTVSKS